MSLPLGFKYAPWIIIKSKAVMNLSPYCGSLSGIRKNWIILSLGLEPWPHCRYKMWKPLCHCHRLLWTPFLLSLTLRDGTVHYTLRRCWGSNPGLQGTTHCLTGWTDAWKTTWPRNRKTIFQKVTIFSESNFFSAATTKISNLHWKSEASSDGRRCSDSFLFCLLQILVFQQILEQQSF